MAKSRRRHLCGVPPAHCKGADTTVPGSIGHRIKAHGSPEEAFKCHASFLLSRGYTKVGTREFEDPETGYHLLLTKKSRFGAPLRKGKTVDGSKGSRYVPKKNGKISLALGGVIIG